MVTSNPKHVIADFPHIWALFDHEKSKYSVFEVVLGEVTLGVG